MEFALSSSQIVLAGGFVKPEEDPSETITNVVVLDVPDSKLEERVRGRWVHAPSGRSYNATFAPPKSLLAAGEGAQCTGGEGGNMLDDETGDLLTQREDDTAPALQHRLEKYHEQTVPILKHYESARPGVVVHVDGNQDPELVRSEITKGINKSLPEKPRSSL